MTASTRFQQLPQAEKETLFDALYYLHVAELQGMCADLTIDQKGKKGALIERIQTFLEKGQRITEPNIHPQSRARKGEKYPLHPNTLMLFGAYKNDARTRALFKQLIGNHFHFTAFGVDWLHEHWIKGNPPTYQEFANMWIQEQKARKQKTVPPKEEWAYINFTQQYTMQNPQASHKEITQAWNTLRHQRVVYVQSILRQLLK